MVKTTQMSDRSWSIIFCVTVYYWDGLVSLTIYLFQFYTREVKKSHRKYNEDKEFSTDWFQEWIAAIKI